MYRDGLQVRDHGRAFADDVVDFVHLGVHIVGVLHADGGGAEDGDGAAGDQDVGVGGRSAGG